MQINSLATTARFKQHHQAVHTELDGELVLFQSNTCDYLVLNETASSIWNSLNSQPTMAELCKYLQSEYEVNPDECKTAVETWLKIALEKKLISVLED